jgi:hypothetical protein
MYRFVAQLKQEAGELDSEGGGGIGGGIGGGAPVADAAPVSDAAPSAQATYDFESPELYAQFMQSLPEESRERGLFKNTKSIKSLAEQALNSESALGRKRLQAPQDDWGDAEWDEFNTQIRPETADLYKARESVSVFTEGAESTEYEMDPETSDLLKGVAHNLGLPQGAYPKLEQAWAEHNVQANQQLDAQIKEAVHTQNLALQEEWGLDYTANHKSANETFEVLAKQVPELNELVEWSPIVANHPAVMKLFHALAPHVQNLGAPVTGVGGSTFNNDSVASVQAQIKDLDAKYGQLINPKDVASLSILDKQKRERILRERTALYQKAYAE